MKITDNYNLKLRITETKFQNFKQIVLILFFVIINILPANSQRTPVKTRILFIFDESNSMTGNWENRTKIDVAKEFLIKMVDSLSSIENVELALRMYGHQSPVPPQDCSDTRLEVPFSQYNAERIKTKLRMTKPKGTTPIARSLEECGDDFPPCNNCRNIIVLITDGLEACDGDPCAIALTLYDKGITVKPFVIGIGLAVDFKDAFECMGQYYNATKEEDFSYIMKDVVTKAINGTTCQINLLNSAGQPKETNVAVTLYDKEKNKIYNNFIHTLNYKGKPDTINLNENLVYRMTVHTIPEVTVDNIKIIAGKHNIIKANTPQGTLNVIQPSGLEHKGVKFIIRKVGHTETLNIQEVFEPQKYLIGKYDLEIFTLPRTYIKGVNIRQSKTTAVKVARPGLVNILMPSKGYSGIYKVENKKVFLVKTINMQTKANIYLQPGHYIAVYRPKGANSTVFSRKQDFIIRSGVSINVNFK